MAELFPCGKRNLIAELSDQQKLDMSLLWGVAEMSVSKVINFLSKQSARGQGTTIELSLPGIGTL